MKPVNAVVIGAGAAGGIVAKELSTAGLSVVLLERGPWYTASVCRKDDLRNQRTTVRATPLGRKMTAIRGSWSTRQAGFIRFCPVKAATRTTPLVWAAERSATRTQAWRYLPQDFRMRHLWRAARQLARGLAHLVRRSRALLRQSRIRDWCFRRLLGHPVSWSTPPPFAHAARCLPIASLKFSGRQPSASACTPSTFPWPATVFPITAADPACVAAGASASPARWMPKTALRIP